MSERIEKLNAFLNSNPADSFVQHALALEYIKLGDDKKARDLFEAILEREPGYVGSYYHLGKLLERNGENELALTCYGKGMEAAKLARDFHAMNELNGAREDLEDR